MVVERNDPDGEFSESRGLQRPQRTEDMPAPLAAMADALRANAEALHRIDESQRKMAETMERTDKSAQVITSTKALNETFRSLSDIQRGLLDALVERRGISLGLVLLLMLLFGVFAAFGGFWAAERFGGGGKDAIKPATHTAALQRATDAERDAAEWKRRHTDARTAVGDWKTRHLASEQEVTRLRSELDTARSGMEPLRLRIKELEGETGVQKARLENFLEYKAQADQAGVLQQRNAILERDSRAQAERIKELERKLTATQEFFGKKLMEGGLGDPDAIKAMAEKLGIPMGPLSATAEKPPPGGEGAKGVVPLSPRAQRVVEQQLRRLFVEQGEESVQLLKFRAIENSKILRDVTLGRYRLGRLVNQIVCKKVSIRLDQKADAVELICEDGHMLTSRPRSTRIPLDEGGHSVFLYDAGLTEWLQRYRYAVQVGEGGLLTWKSVPR